MEFMPKSLSVLSIYCTPVYNICDSTKDKISTKFCRYLTFDFVINESEFMTVKHFKK